MDISAALALHLTTLSDALDGDVDIETQLNAFTRELTSAVASYLGMSVTIALDDHDVTFTIGDQLAIRHQAKTSLLIPLDAVSSARCGSTLHLSAATPGAFVDLAADLTYALGLGRTALVLDGHRDPAAAQADATTLDDDVTINRAIGILVDRGCSLAAAREELRRRTDLGGGTIRHVATDIVLSTARPRPNDP